ncbi:hypothetical protein [Siminovitchia sp. 179-K 8D1 HS]|uniref:hypothetical protein n=1 Tax=Siminovitchia sp. 179-K 8D1 HS TaxID=3142385 RepID=UPI00399EFA4A
MKNVEIVDGVKVYELPEHSYYSVHYIENRDGESYTYTYQRQPVPGSTTVYEDSPACYVELRDDVDISVDSRGDVNVTWASYLPCPIR